MIREIRGRETEGGKKSLFTCLELCLCPEITNVSSQLEQLETLYLPLSKREGSQELTAASSWQQPKMLSASIQCKHERAKKGKKTTRKGGERKTIYNRCHKNIKETSQRNFQYWE